jgi:GAF domain-containing protein
MTEEDDRLVDRDGFARLPGLRRALPDPGGLFATLQRVIDATRVVFQVDGASLALEHEDGSLRWVVVTDGAAGLLEDTQRDLGEGPGLAAYAEAAAVAVIDLATDRRFVRLAAVVTPGGLRGVLAVPVAVAGRPVGALSVYATQPCPWSGIDVAAVGAYAGVVAELVAASMALDAREAEVVELTQALTARVWVEQAKGALVATEGLDLAVASQRLRARARASQRTVADVAREVVQDAQRDRTAVPRPGPRTPRRRWRPPTLRPTRRTLGRKRRPPLPISGSAEPRSAVGAARDPGEHRQRAHPTAPPRAPDGPGTAVVCWIWMVRGKGNETKER